MTELNSIETLSLKNNHLDDFEKLQRAKKKLNLNSAEFNKKQLTENYIRLVKKYNLEKDPKNKAPLMDLNKDYQILKSYLIKKQGTDRLKEGNTEFKLNIFKEPFKKTPPLNFSARLSLLKILTLWNYKQDYIKSINYPYKTLCQCEQICRACLGKGHIESLNTTVCQVCNGCGWVHFCDKCNGSGYYYKTDTVVLELKKNRKIPPSMVFLSKGDCINGQKRTDLLLNIRFMDEGLRKISGNLYYIKYNLNLKDLMGKNLLIDLPLGRPIILSLKKINKIPCLIDISESFKNVIIDSKPLRIKIYLCLELSK